MKISDHEFGRRMEQFKQEIANAGLDAVIVHGNEVEYANVRYLSDYWPVFESAGIAVAPGADPILLIGPESEAYAEDRSKLPKIRKLIPYRESAEPEYPGVQVSTFNDIFNEICPGKDVNKVGLVGYASMTLPVYSAIKDALPGAELVKADEVMSKMRMIKTDEELALLREAFRISEMEVELPWMELTSKYDLQENMTFQVDTFLQGDDFGLRWEDGARVTADGVEEFSGRKKEIIEL